MIRPTCHPDKSHARHGLCWTCYRARLHEGHRWPVPSRRGAYTVDASGCWLWTNGSPTEYGRMHHEGRVRLAHRVHYEWANGRIADGLTIDHLCRVRNCVNPAHMEPVTQAENNRRKPRSELCPNGHDRSQRDHRGACRPCRVVQVTRKRAELRSRGITRLTEPQRRRIFERDGHACHWCGGAAAVIDHVVPTCEGGTKDPSNLVAACWPCNARHAGRIASWNVSRAEFLTRPAA